jgi:hypothetical protein
MRGASLSDGALSNRFSRGGVPDDISKSNLFF